MKLSKKDPSRELHIMADGTGFLLSERISYTPLGYSRKKWDVERIWISADELKKALGFAQESDGDLDGQKQAKSLAG